MHVVGSGSDTSIAPHQCSGFSQTHIEIPLPVTVRHSYDYVAPHDGLFDIITCVNSIMCNIQDPLHRVDMEFRPRVNERNNAHMSSNYATDASWRAHVREQQRQYYQRRQLHKERGLQPELDEEQTYS